MKAKQPDSSVRSMAGTLGQNEHYGLGSDYGMPADKRFTHTRDNAMGVTVGDDYRRENNRPLTHEDMAATNVQVNFDSGLVIRQPL